MKNFKLKILFGLLLLTYTTSFAQNDCASAVTVTDLTGVICATSVPSTTNALLAGTCEEGANDTWFVFTAQGGSATITVSNPTGGANWNPEFLVISSSNNTCGGSLFQDNCTDGVGNYTSINASLTGLVSGDTYWVVVSSGNNSSAGTINVCVDNPAVVLSCVDNDECTSAATISLNAVGGAAACITDCNNGATSGLAFAPSDPCMDMPNETVWYEFTTDASAATIDILMTSASLTQPHFALYTDNGCGTTWTNVACLIGSGGSASVTSIPITAGATYILAVSDGAGAEGTFDLCITQNPDNSACNTNQSLVVSSTSMGSPLSGPYQPGEVVSFCYTITDWTQFNCNYIGAVVPSFGDCWDPSSFNAQGMPVNVTTPLNVNGVIQPCAPGPPCAWSGCAGTPAGSWQWFTAGSATYNVAGGYYPAGTPMPGGWYFMSSYNPTNGACTPDPTDPDNTFGDGNFPNCGTNTFDYTLCFSLTAGPAGYCGSGNTDCTVSIKTFADGEFGAWNSVGCTSDIPAVYPASLLCCPVFNNPGPQTVCDTYTFPVITGSLLTGTEAFFTGPNGTGTQYNAGAIVNYATFGAYPVTIYIYDPLSCGTEISFQLTIGQTPVVTFAAPADLCINAGVQAGLGGGAPAGGVYSGPGVTDNGNGLTYSFNPLTAGVGTHTITYTVTTLPNPPACSSFSTDNIQVFALPVLSFTAPADLCISAGLQSGLGGATPAGGVYSGPGVTDGGNGTTYSFNPATAGVGTHTITYTYTDANSCTNFITDQVVVFALPVLAFTAPADLCINAGNQSGLGGATPSGGVYSGPGVTDGGNGTSYSFNPATAGVGIHTITYTYTNANGCTNFITDNIQVFALPVLTFTAPADLCINAGLQSGLGGATPAGGVYSGSGVTDGGNGTTYSFNPATAGVGTHTITYTYTDANSCTNFITDQVVVFALPVVTFAPLAGVCLNTGIQSGLGGGSPVGGVYSGSGVTNDGNGSTFTFNPATAGVGTHVITYTYTDGNSCTSSATTNLMVYGTPIISGTLSACVNATTQLTGSGSPAIVSPWLSSNTGVATVDVNGLVTGIAAGSATITYTDINGCQATAVVTINPLPVISLSPQPPSSCNGSDGEILVSGAGTGSVVWSGASAGSDSPVALPYNITGLIAGSYTVTFTNTTTGCVSNSPSTILNNPFAPVIDPIANYSSCNVDYVVPDPLVAITGTDLTGSQAFYSAPGGNAGDLIATGTIINSAMSPYTIYAYDNNGACSSEISFVVDVNSNPTALVSPDPAQTCQGSALILNGNPAGGSGTYTTHTWTGNTAILNATNVLSPTVLASATAGTYNLTYTVTDNNGCTGFDDIQVVINPIPTATASTSTPSICVGDDILLSSTASTGTYSWTGPNTFTSSSQNPSIIGATTAATGTYSLTVTENGCTSPVSTVNVTVNPIPTATASTSTPSICEGDDILLSSTASTGTYSWTGPNTFSSTSQNPSITGATTAATGTYSLSVTENGCTSPVSTVNVTVNPIPTATASTSTPSICVGDDILLSSTASTGTYSWTGPNTFSSTSQNPSITGATTAATGTYSLTVTENGCTSPVSTVNVTVNPIPTATASTSTPSICEGDDILLSSTASTGTYSWTGPNTFSSTSQNPSITGATTASSGTYSLTVTENGCTSPVSTVNVTVNPIPTATASTSTPSICEGDDILLSSTASTGTYSWTGPNTFSSTSQNPSITGATTAASGTYSLTVTENGCTSPVSTVNVTVNPIPTATASTSTPAICEGDDILLSSTVSTGTYSWTGPNSFTSTSQNPSIIGATTAANGTYSLTVTENGCTSPVSTVDVSVIASPVLDPVADQTACDSYTLPPISGSNLTGSESYYNDSQANGGTVISGQISTTQTVWIYDGNGTCDTEVSFLVTINVTDDASFTLTNYCEGAANSATVTGTTGGTFSFSPNPGDGASIDAASGSIANGIGGTTYSVLYTTNGACPASSTEQVTVTQLPLAVASTLTPEICAGLDASLLAETVTGASYSWAGPAGFSSSVQNPVIEDAGSEYSGTYTLVVTVNGCSSQPATTTMLIEPCDLVIPTAFTPGAVPNNVWEIINLDERYPDNIVRIYNRWGSVVYEHESSAASPYSLNPWEGTNQKNNEPLPVASYYYVIEFNDGSGEGASGTVTIIKN